MMGKGEKASPNKAEEEQCFSRICGVAEENMQPVPFNYFIEGNMMYCEREFMPRVLTVSN